MDLSFLEEIVVKYLKNHPEVIERLVEALIKRLLDQLDPPKA